jgi:Zn-dependent protease
VPNSTPKPTPHNAWSVVLGRIAGIQFEVHVTFVMVLAWVVIGLARRGAPTANLVTVLLFALGIAVSVVLHELGHALVARRYGLSTAEISLTPMGAFSNIEKMPETPRTQLVVVLAGPAVSLLLAGAGFAVAALTGGVVAPTSYDDPSTDFASQLGWFNLVMGLYNLLPVFPMDGGRALRAGLALFMPYVKATRYATRVAQALSLALAVAGLTYGPIFLLTAVWVWMNARKEVKSVRTHYALKPFSVRDVMVTGPTLESTATLQDASRVFGSTFQPEFPVMSGTDVVGVLGFKELVAGLEKHGPTAPITEAMRHEFNGVDAQMSLEAVLQQMKDSSDPLVMVTENDRYVGVLPRENLNELIRIARALERNESHQAE